MAWLERDGLLCPALSWPRVPILSIGLQHVEAVGEGREEEPRFLTPSKLERMAALRPELLMGEVIGTTRPKPHPLREWMIPKMALNLRKQVLIGCCIRVIMSAAGLVGCQVEAINKMRNMRREANGLVPLAPGASAPNALWPPAGTPPSSPFPSLCTPQRWWRAGGARAVLRCSTRRGAARIGHAARSASLTHRVERLAVFCAPQEKSPRTTRSCAATITRSTSNARCQVLGMLSDCCRAQQAKHPLQQMFRRWRRGRWCERCGL